MTNIDLLVAEMELSEYNRRGLARELTRLRQLESECRRHHRRLPPLVQAALRAEAKVVERDPPPQGTPGLFHQRNEQTSAG